MAKNLELADAKGSLLKVVRLIAVILLVIGLVALAASLYDLITNYSLMTMLNAPVEAEGEQAAAAALEVDGFAITTAYILLAASGLLLIIGSLMLFIKGKARTMINLYTAAIIFAIYPLIYFAILIAQALVAIAYVVVAIAIIALAVLAIIKGGKIVKVRWMSYLKEMLGEVKKLSWLSKKDLAKHTFAVFVFVIAMGLVIFLLDFGFNKGVKGLLSIDFSSSTAEPSAEPETDAEPTAEPESTDGN